jgi:hypothetical protein
MSENDSFYSGTDVPGNGLVEVQFTNLGFIFFLLKHIILMWRPANPGNNKRQV